MKSTICLIRHGVTKGNQMRWYYGASDLGLSPSGRKELEDIARNNPYPHDENTKFFRSELSRTAETLEILFGEQQSVAISNLNEMNFGVFEKHTYEELEDDKAFKEWVFDETGEINPPEGESRNEFKNRVMLGIEEVLAEHGTRMNCSTGEAKSICVLHGGVIGTIMWNFFGDDSHTMWDFIPPPGSGYKLALETDENGTRPISYEVIDHRADTGHDKGSPSDKPLIIKLEDVVKTFKTKTNTVQALKGINLSIAKGEIFGIIGLSGAGKSTIVRCMNLLERPTSGRVLVDGIDMMSLSKNELNKQRRDIAMIFQQFNLLMQRNCLENICFPLEIAGCSKDKAVERAKELLEVVELSDKAKAYPSQLSGGQKQRIAIARALATNPKVLLCDEATSALDPKTTRAILSLLKKINEEYGITIVIITHEMSVIQQICNTVAIIENGVIAESGSVKDIFANPRTEAARKLVFPANSMTTPIVGKRLVRMVFDGRSTFEPVISNMIMQCGEPVNIMYANVQNIDGVSVGQMVIQISENRESAEKQLKYLKSQGIKFEEIEEVGSDA